MGIKKSRSLGAPIAAHPMQVEVEKEEGEKGTYLHPVEHGEPEQRGTHFKEIRRRR